MSFLLLALTPHANTPRPRTGPELSDLALFAFAALAVWLLRRALRRRFANRSGAKD